MWSGGLVCTWIVGMCEIGRAALVEAKMLADTVVSWASDAEMKEVCRGAVQYTVGGGCEP